MTRFKPIAIDHIPILSKITMQIKNDRMKYNDRNNKYP